MRGPSWKLMVGTFLVVLSGALYLAHYLIFRDVHHILIYGIGDLAFLPIEVLLVTIIIHQVLGDREKRIRLDKLNMVIGAFFSEVGTKLLSYLSDLDPKLEKIREDLIVTGDWSEKEFKRVSGRMRNYDYTVDFKKVRPGNMKSFLLERRDFMLRLLENPNLLEHETFTDLLQAVFHLTEEFSNRESVEGLPEADFEHLAGDVERIYGLLVHEWLSYMEHLKDGYPYMFSLAMRTNPFDQEASVEFR